MIQPSPVSFLEKILLPNFLGTPLAHRGRAACLDIVMPLLSACSCCMLCGLVGPAISERAHATSNQKALPVPSALVNVRSCSTQTDDVARRNVLTTVQRETLLGGAKLIKSPAGPAELNARNSDTGDSQSSCSQKASGTLGTGRFKFSRRFLHDSRVYDESYSSVGHSAEEIARRAEPKRLMHKRIQDQLSGAFSDSSSQSSEIEGGALPNSDYLTLSDHRREGLECGTDRPLDPDGTNATPSAAGGQALESASMTLINGAQLSPPPLAGPAQYSEVPNGNQQSRPAGVMASNKLIQISAPVKDSLPASPVSSTSKPARHEHSRTLPDLEGCPETISLDDQSVIGVWLITQGLRSRESYTQYVEELKEVHSPSAEPPVAQNPTMTCDSGSHDATLDVGSRDLTAPFASWQPWAKTHVIDGTKNGKATMSSATDLEVRPTSSMSRTEIQIARLTSNMTIAPDPDRVTAANSFVDEDSSHYPSVDSSVQPSPIRSRPEVNVLSAKDLRTLQLSPFQCLK